MYLLGSSSPGLRPWFTSIAATVVWVSFMGAVWYRYDLKSIIDETGRYELPPRDNKGLSRLTPIILKQESIKTLFTEHNITGAESFLHDRDDIYITGASDGRIWEIDLNTSRVAEIVRTGGNVEDEQMLKNCGQPPLESLCGRPLGLAFHLTHDIIIVADAAKGLLRVTRSTKEVEVLLSSKGDEHGEMPFINSVVVDSDGSIYFTESSTIFGRPQFFASVLKNDKTGRLSHYDMETRKRSVLVDNLSFANGVALHPGDSNTDRSLLFVEMGQYKIWRYPLTVPNRKPVEWTVLPVVGDNLHYVDHRRFPSRRSMLSDLVLRLRVLRAIVLRIPSSWSTIIKLIHTSSGVMEFTSNGDPNFLLIDGTKSGPISDGIPLPHSAAQSVFGDIGNDETVLLLGSYKHGTPLRAIRCS